MTVLLLCGSLQERSANRAALDVARCWFDEHGAHVIDFDELAAIEPFTTDPMRASSALGRFRAAIAQAHCVMIAAPEYAGGLSGTVKNALDWIVGTGELYAKAVVVMSAGLSGGEHAREQLIRTLTWQGAHVIDDLAIAGPRTKSDVHGAFDDPTTIVAINECARVALEASTMSGTQRRTLAAEVIARHGIDATHLAPGG